MTGKTALIVLKAKGVLDTRYCKKTKLNECFDAIEKDLDVLEIIKGKLMWIENDKIYIGLQNDTYIELTEEDFNYDDRYRILKEWLENEN